MSFPSKVNYKSDKVEIQNQATGAVVSSLDASALIVPKAVINGMDFNSCENYYVVLPSSAITIPFTTAKPDMAIRFVRVGQTVTMFLLGWGGTGNSTTGIVTLTGVIPARFIPNYYYGGLIPVYQGTPAVFTYGMARLEQGSSNIHIYAGPMGSATQDFAPGANPVGIYSSVLQYGTNAA